MSLSSQITLLVNHIAIINKIIAVSIDKKQDKENWFTLVSGYLTIEELPPIASGEVLKYTYTGGAIRYRFIANDDSEDNFYKNYNEGVFTLLVASKNIIL